MGNRLGASPVNWLHSSEGFPVATRLPALVCYATRDWRAPRASMHQKERERDNNLYLIPLARAPSLSQSLHSSAFRLKTLPRESEMETSRMRDRYFNFGSLQNLK